MTVTATVPHVDADAPAAATEPRWARPALAVLLGATALLYLWGLGAAGFANEYYAAAVQAGTQSWKALLFGSLDSGNGITVDKPPAALWLMGLSGRLFGFSSWSMLVPQALLGVGAVALLTAAVRRTSGPGAGLVAGTILALTPVAALMFRFNNPDALLVTLLVAAAYAVVRAVDGAPRRWVAFAGVALGLAFLTKLLQALLVAPALALVVLIALPVGLGERLRVLAIGAATTVVSGGWLIALIELWPAESRPYIGGSTDNSLLQLALGYNGLGRVFGGSGNPVGGEHPGPPGRGGPPGASLMFGGDAGVTRLFGPAMGTEISWLLPAALIGLAAGVWLTRSASRTDRVRAGLLLWGGWLVVTAVVFSGMRGIMHPYYTVALAPAIAAVSAIAVAELWRARTTPTARITVAAMVTITAVWDAVLLARTPDWLPWLRWTLPAAAVLVAGAVVLRGGRPGRGGTVWAIAALMVALAAPAAYTVQTVAGSHSNGPIPISGPPRPAAQPPSEPGPGEPGPPPRQAANPELEALIADTDTRWAAATVGSHGAGNLELATGKAVLAIGGFSGGDNWPSLERFQRYVADGQVRYFIDGGNGPGRHRDPAGAATQITAWVRATFPAQQVGAASVYDLTG
ncbi:glycosyltransferase family 39 protein [Mycobacterium koreense]|uniref:Glycosyl transferase n=1 Tax=Mycolicibacillus koreensis TaxID=1069220 RepID=A0A7I7SHT8_9MYCO|nr:glycosyltransferase family 39 protein [Mycolicibacillus koreensis]MCV7250116.1 glycosyltransferase family 39 protein [Mycolicibacillus koreensis]OSC31812.1 glycosyl transferase [Mycolicibacillus koreensis]BBY56110.1 glycosyl transferase [Mycolicibacillus koreensis]